MPSFRALLAAAFLTFTVALALTLALPESGAVQAQGDPPEFGASGAGVTPAAATLTVSEVRYTTAVLTLSGHTGPWYYQADKAPHTSCTHAASNTLLGLTHNTTYTYTAYSDNACTSGNELGSAVTFTTLEKKLVLSDWGQFEKLGQNTATLDYRGFSHNLAHLKGDDSGAPHSTCTKWDDVDEKGASVIALTGLDPNTEYTYRGYEDSACATEVASITFTTLPAVLTANSLGLTTANLALTGNLGRAFYYQADKGPDNTCTLQGAGGVYQSVSLSGLTKDTEYTYTAYTDSACTSTKKLDDVTFTTLSVVPTLSVSYVSPTTAKLTMSEGWTGLWMYSADGYRSGSCFFGGEDGDDNIAYLTGLTPGATYTFKAYAYISGIVNFCTAEIGADVTFTTPAQLTECDGLSVAAAVTRNEGDEAWSRYVEVTNNTDQAIHDVRALTYYKIGRISTANADPLYDAQPNARMMSELQPGTTGRVGYTSGRSFVAQLVEVNGVVQRVNPATAAVLCEAVIESSWWRDSLGPSLRRGPANPRYWVSTQLDNPLPGAGENATFTVTAYATTYDQLLQACVNLHFDGVTPVDADLDGNHDVVIYDGPNGKYKEDGTLNVDSSNPPVALGYRRAGRLEYDSDGYDEDVASPRHRPQCSDSDGKFEGSLFRIGNTDRRTTSGAKWPTTPGAQNLPLTYTVKVPVAVAATGSGPRCLTATVRALPAEQTVGNVTAYEKMKDNTAKACLGPPPSGDPSLPVLFQEGRADLVTQHKCADGTSFPCDGKSADDLALYVNSATDAASDTGDADNGNAADNAGSTYRAFRTTDVVMHVADADDTRKALNNNQSASEVHWQSGSDQADYPGNWVGWNDEFGVLPGVAVKVIRPSGYTGKIFCYAMEDKTPGGRPGGLNVRRALYAKYRASWNGWWNFDQAATTRLESNWTMSSIYPMTYEFRALGTYVFDLTASIKTSTTSTDCSVATVPTDSSHTGTYKFHVGPAADLSVHEGGASASVASGKRTFTIVAESEATAEIDAYITVGSGLHTHTEQVNLHTLKPEVTVTAGGAAIPAANVSQVGATAGAYDTAAGVWTLPEGFQGQATLTLVADASAVSSVKAEIENSAEVCENADGTPVTDGKVDGRAAVDRATCEFNKDGTSSSKHWGAYQRCFKTNAEPVGHDPDHVSYIEGETGCTGTNTWHTTEVYDWNTNNNEVTFTPDDAGFTLTARDGDRSSIDLLWAKQAGADEYAIYSVSTADLTSTDNLGALLGPNQIAVVPGDVTTYYHDGLKRGQKRQYLIRARQDGRPFALSNLAGATAQIPGQTQQGPPASRAPGSVGSLTAARKSGDDTTIEVNWNAPSSGATGYDVQYRSRLGRSSSYGNWIGLSTQQGGTTYTFRNAGGGTSYQFQVRAVNVYGGQTNNGSWRTSDTVSTVSSPSQVQSLSATRKSGDDTTIEVRWKAPSSGTTPTGYNVEYRFRTGNSGAWSDWAAVPNRTVDVDATDSYDLTGATGARSYQFRVQTVTTSGGTIYGTWLITGVVPAAAGPGQVSNLTATRQPNETTIIVSWTNPTNAANDTYYEVEYQIDNGVWGNRETNQTASPYTLHNAAAGSKYVFRVRAVNPSGDASSRADDIHGSWRTSNIVRGLAAGDIASVTAERDTSDPAKINVNWSTSNRATGYDVEYRKNSGSWQRAATKLTPPTPPQTPSYTLENAGGVEKYTFRVRGVSDAGNGEWTVSGEVGPPPLQYQGIDVGVDYVTVNVLSGPWWYKYQAHDGWTSCAQVAAGGSHTITNLIPERAYRVDLFKTSACNWNDGADFFRKVQFTTLSDINDWGDCWNVDDCRSIDNPNDFNNHTHKRQYLAGLGVTTSGCDWSTRKTHTHGWPDGGHGPHWHCSTR